MRKLEFSKKIYPGTLVTKRGNKYIRYNGRGILAGVYHRAETMTIVGMDGALVTVHIPEGITIQGRAMVND